MNLEKKILKHLIYDEEYTRKVLPFIKSEYFGDQSEKVLFEQIQFYVTKYNAMPSREALEIEIDNRANLTDDQHKSTVQLIKEISAEEITNDRDWLIDETETFCQEKIYIIDIYMKKKNKFVSNDSKLSNFGGNISSY